MGVPHENKEKLAEVSGEFVVRFGAVILWVIRGFCVLRVQEFANKF